MQDNKKFLLSILFILCVLISLSAVAAQDSSDIDADIQMSSSDISNLAIAGVSDDQKELGKMADSPSATLGYSHQYNNSDESLKSSSDSDKLGDDEISVYVPTNEPDDPNISVTINDPGEIQVYVNIGDPSYTYTVSGNTFKDIQDTINMARSYDTVIIPAGTYVGNGTPLVISSHITLMGNGNPTLDAQNLSQILIVSDGYGDVTVNGINFINGNAPGSEEYGGAIVWGGARGSIIKCNFINNHAGKYGGAIVCKHYDCLIENCNFYYNTAKDCGAVIAANHRFKIKNCNFIGNSANEGTTGAVYLAGDNSLIQNSYFANNSAELCGAVTIRASNGKILSTTFENNIAERGGGAVVLLSEGCTIEGCHYNNNFAKQGGAIIAIENNINIIGCDFTGNHATEFGGAILWLGDNNKLSDSSFTNNRVEEHGGGAVYMDGNNLTVINSNFENNHAQYAGALRLSGTDGKLIDSTFINNSASGLSGAVYHYSLNGIIKNSCFVSNSAKIGAAVELTGNNTTVRDSNFTNNQAIDYGGAIYAMNIDGIVDNCNFVKNSATATPSYGSAILWGRDKGSNLYLNMKVVNSYFSNNKDTTGHITFANFGDPINYDCLVTDCSFNDDYNTEISVSSNSDLSLEFTIKAYYNYFDNSIAGVPFSCIGTLYCYADGSYDSWGYPPSFYTYIKSKPYLTVEIYNNSNNKLISNASVQTDNWGSASYNYASLPDGEYRYRVYNLGDDGVLPGSSEGSFEIHRTPTDLSITVSNANYPETPMANVTASSPGTYTIVIDGNTYSVSFSQDEITNGGGQASKMVSLGILDASNDYVVTVSYEINSQYQSASTQTSFNVYQGVPEIDIAGTQVYYGQDAVLNYVITDGIEIGSVVIKRGGQTLAEGTDYTVTIAGDKIIIRGLAEGTYTINMTTSENTNYISIASGATLIVNPLVDLSIDMSVNNHTPYYGDTVAYTITVSNNGPSTSTDTIVSFTVPSGINVSSPDASYIGNGVWNISRIASGSENAVVVTLYATANSKETLTASVSVTSREDESNGEDNCIDLSINPLEISDIHVSGNIAFEGNVLRVGDELTCTITVANRGPCDALNVRVTDEFDSGLLNLIGATLDGVSINYDGGYTIDSIANGSSCIIVLTFEVISNGTIENTLRAESIVVDPNETNNEIQCESVIAIPLVDLIINASVDNSTPHYADTVTYTLTVSNCGPSAATDITVTAAIPSGMNAISTDACYTGNGVWKISSLGVGSENAITLSLNTAVESWEALTTEFTVTSHENDSNAENNNASANLKAVPIIDLKISGISNVTTFENIGDLIAFTITVVNDGPCDASDVNVPVALSEFVKFISADGSFDNTSNIWKIGNLSSKDSCSLVLTLSVIEYEDIKNSISVNANEIDSNESDNNCSISVTAKTFPTVIVANNMVTTAIDAAVDGNKGQYFSVTLKDDNNNPLAGQRIEITLNNVPYTVQTNSKGIASVQVNIKNAGSYKVKISFAGSKKYLGSSASASIKVNKQKPKLASSNKKFKAKAKTKKLTATLKTTMGKVLKSKKVTFTIKGKKYIVKTNKKGVATAKIKLTKKGKYVCKIMFARDSTYSAITKSIKVVIK